MQNMKVKIGLGVLAVIAIGALFIVFQTTPAKTVSPLTTTSSNAKTYSVAEVASHKNKASCWTMINGNVYDLTSWISEHPGGAEAILSLCGTDGTAAFTAQHGGQRDPEAELKSLLIGKLK